MGCQVPGVIVRRVRGAVVKTSRVGGKTVRRFRCLMALGLALLLLLFVAPVSLADDGLYTVRERFGVNVATSFSGSPEFPGQLSDFAGVGELGFGWYSNWTIEETPERPDGMEFAQLLHVRPWPPDWDAIGGIIEANPGSLWIVGNEPETRGQGQLTPEEYAAVYHDAYAFIKEQDASAQVAIGGVCMPTPLRLEWLDLCLESYRDSYGSEMPVDVWNIHVQILQEKRYGWGCGIPYGLDADEGRLYEIIDNCDAGIFEQLVYEFCVWLGERGQRDKPLIISEYGVLMPSSYLPNGDDDVLAFMEGTFDHMLLAKDPELGYAEDGGRLVQRWMWFSLNFPSYDDTSGGFNGGLYDWRHPEDLTVFGEFYRDYANSVAFGDAYLPLVADTWIDPLHPDALLGKQGRLKLRSDGAGNDSAALLMFDTSGLPEDMVVDSAALGMHVVARTNAQPIDVVVAPARCDWSEATTYSSWQECGMPIRPEAELTLDASHGWYEANIADLVTRWMAGTIANQGILLDIASAGNCGNVTYDICASEWVEGLESAPTLHVSYLYHE